MKFLPLILRNLMRSRRRTLLTIASVALSVFIFAALMSLPGVVNQLMMDRADSLRLVVHSKAGFFYSLPVAYRNQIASIRHVEAVTGESIFMGTYRDPNDLIPSAAMDPEYVEQTWPDWGITPELGARLRHARSAALVGSTLLKRYRWRVGDVITLHGTIYPVDVQLQIVGTLGGKAPPVALMFRRDRLDEALGRPGTVNVFWAKVDSSKSIPAVIAEIDERFANSAVETETETELGMAMGRMRDLGLLLNGAKVLAAVVIFAIGLVAANTAAMSVRERRKELAVMRAIGFARKVLFGCIVSEGFAIGIVGGVLGCLAAFAVLKFVPYMSETLGLLALLIRFPRSVVAESLLVAMLLGIVSSLVPAILALRREVVTEIRAV